MDLKSSNYKFDSSNIEKLHISFLRVKSEHIINNNFDKSYLTNSLLTILENKSPV
jgi:hypothetical protein